MPAIINPYNIETLCAAIGNRLPREDAETLHVYYQTTFRDGSSLAVLRTARQESNAFLKTEVVERLGIAMTLAEAADMLAEELRNPGDTSFVEYVSPDGGIISDQGAAAMGKVRR